MRAIIIVLDSLGVGELPDASEYGDIGADTIAHILDSRDIEIPNLRKLGFGNIEGNGGVQIAGGRLSVSEPEGFYCRLAEKSSGKDTITGHWEIAGIETKEPFRTYHDGFPDELMTAFVKETGRGYLGNCVASGTEIIEELGNEHEKTGKVIVYTSADSVFQVAANVDVVPLDELYEICAKARHLLKGKYSCGRVIARPYVKDSSGKRVRTSDRRDYSLSPPGKTLLDTVCDSGQKVVAIGKIHDIFNGCGISESVHIESNDDGISKTIAAIERDFNGLIFTNLVDFDSKYGHRRNPVGYGKAIEEFDRRLPEILRALKDDDLLLMCSDHGNDPVHSGFDHTREYIFCLGTGKMTRRNVNLGTRNSFADIGSTVGEYLNCSEIAGSPGKSFLADILKGNR